MNAASVGSQPLLCPLIGVAVEPGTLRRGPRSGAGVHRFAAGREALSAFPEIDRPFKAPSGHASHRGISAIDGRLAHSGAVGTATQDESAGGCRHGIPHRVDIYRALHPLGCETTETLADDPATGMSRTGRPQFDGRFAPHHIRHLLSMRRDSRKTTLGRSPTRGHRAAWLP
jgi:hypothetical protein